MHIFQGRGKQLTVLEKVFRNSFWKSHGKTDILGKF